MATKLCALWKKVTAIVSAPLPTALDDQLVQDLHRLWASRNQSDLQLRHDFGRLLNLRLNAADQKRQPYGAAIMKRVSDELSVSRTELHRMCKFARVFKTVAACKAAHAEATTWEKVKALLAQYNEGQPSLSKRAPQDQTLAFWKRNVRSLETVLENFDKAPVGTESKDVQPCLQKAKAVVEQLRERLSTCATNSQSDPVSSPSQEGENPQESIPLSSAQ